MYSLSAQRLMAEETALVILSSSKVFQGVLTKYRFRVSGFPMISSPVLKTYSQTLSGALKRNLISSSPSSVMKRYPFWFILPD